MFFLAYSYYPQKHVNILLDGNCYELTGKAYNQYKNLEWKREKLIKINQIQAIGNYNINIPITSSGTKAEITDFVFQNHINVIKYLTLGKDNLNIDKTILIGTISNGNLKEIIDKYPNSYLPNFTNTVSNNIGIQPTPYITNNESQIISNKADQFVTKGIKDIIKGQYDGIRNAECRR